MTVSLSAGLKHPSDIFEPIFFALGLTAQVKRFVDADFL